MHRLSPGFLGVCAMALLAPWCLGSCITTHPAEGRLFTLPRVNALYAKMEATEQSDLKDGLAEIIHKRLTCYSENPMAPERVRDCRRNYVRQIVKLCRARIQSAPQLGEAILCFQNCPISHAICEGDNIDCEHEDCISAESKCIEYCLDRYWRGGNFPRNTPYPNK